MSLKSPLAGNHDKLENFPVLLSSHEFHRLERSTPFLIGKHFDYKLIRNEISLTDGHVPVVMTMEKPESRIGCAKTKPDKAGIWQNARVFEWRIFHIVFSNVRLGIIFIIPVQRFVQYPSIENVKFVAM